MRISVVNHTDGKLTDQEVNDVIRAVGRQVKEDFEPHWHMGATLRLEGEIGQNPGLALAELRGDAIIYLFNEVNVDDAIGFHDANAKGIPYGFVFTELSRELKEPWSVTFSHEVLELIADPFVNLLVQGPHPRDRRRLVFHWYEMCDAVQTERYTIDGVELSNFVLPAYFTRSEEEGGRNDFLGSGLLQSFGVNPGGYVGFFDPQKSRHDTVFGDHIAEARAALKKQAGITRRAVRYKQPFLTR